MVALQVGAFQLIYVFVVWDASVALPWHDRINVNNNIYVFLSNFLLVAMWEHTVNKHTPTHTGFSKIDQSVFRKTMKI